jgi:hypothetical protein
MLPGKTDVWNPVSESWSDNAGNISRFASGDPTAWLSFTQGVPSSLRRNLQRVAVTCSDRQPAWRAETGRKSAFECRQTGRVGCFKRHETGPQNLKSRSGAASIPLSMTAHTKTTRSLLGPAVSRPAVTVRAACLGSVVAVFALLCCACCCPA